MIIYSIIIFFFRSLSRIYCSDINENPVWCHKTPLLDCRTRRILLGRGFFCFTETNQNRSLETCDLQMNVRLRNSVIFHLSYGRTWVNISHVNSDSNCSRIDVRTLLLQYNTTLINIHRRFLGTKELEHRN